MIFVIHIWISVLINYIFPIPDTKKYSIVLCYHTPTHWSDFWRDSKNPQVILNNALDNEKGTTDIQSALMYFDSITKYMQQLRTALEELRDDIE